MGRSWLCGHNQPIIGCFYIYSYIFNQLLSSGGVRFAIGAIFIGSNVAVSQRSKHIDVRYHFVREFVHDGFIRIIFVKTVDNDADIFTKNLSGELHEKHAVKMVGEKGNGKG